MVNMWEALLDNSVTDNTVINLPNWTARATLDAIGG
jgi:hypothetical protein